MFTGCSISLVSNLNLFENHRYRYFESLVIFLLGLCYNLNEIKHFPPGINEV